jgi:hypothetical protein
MGSDGNIGGGEAGLFPTAEGAESLLLMTARSERVDMREETDPGKLSGRDVVHRMTDEVRNLEGASGERVLEGVMGGRERRE